MAAAVLKRDMSCVVLSCSGSTSPPNVALWNCNLSCTVALASSHAFQTCWHALKYSSMASLLSLYSHSCGSCLVVWLLLYTKCCMASRGQSQPCVMCTDITLGLSEGLLTHWSSTGTLTLGLQSKKLTTFTVLGAFCTHTLLIVFSTLSS